MRIAGDDRRESISVAAWNAERTLPPERTRDRCV